LYFKDILYKITNSLSLVQDIEHVYLIIKAEKFLSQISQKQIVRVGLVM